MMEYNVFEHVAELVDEHGIDGSGRDIAAMVEFADNQHTVITADNIEGVADEFWDAYLGEYEAERGMYDQLWATGYVDELIDAGAVEVPDDIRPYFDTLRFAQDMELGGDIYTIESGPGSVFVFSAV